MNRYFGGSDGGCDMPSQVDTKIGYTDGAQPTPRPQTTGNEEKNKNGN